MQTAFVRHVDRCAYIRSGLQVTVQFHLLDEQYLDLATTDGQATAGSRTTGIVNPACNVTSFASRYGVLFSLLGHVNNMQNSTCRLPSIYNRYLQRLARRLLDNGIFIHNYTQMGAPYWSISRTCRGAWSSETDSVGRGYNKRMPIFNNNRSSMHSFESRHLGQDLSQTGIEWRVTGHEWHATVPWIAR